MTGEGSDELQVIVSPGTRVAAGHRISPASAASVTLMFTNVAVPRLET